MRTDNPEEKLASFMKFVQERMHLHDYNADELYISSCFGFTSH